jgi:hypothetical protein
MEATSTPAPPARKPLSRNVSAIIRSTRMPMSWAATGFSAVARRAWPTTVRVKNACSTAIAARPTASITRFCGTTTMPATTRPFGRYGCG